MIPLVVVLLLAAQAIRVNGQLANLGGKVRVAGAAEALQLVGVDGVAGLPASASVPSSQSSPLSQTSAAQASKALRSRSSTGPSPRLGVPAATLSPATAAASEPAAELGPVVVIARQWSWEFVYPDGVRSAELHLPVNRPVRFRLVSLDVLHAMSIPAFRLRQDVVPGSVIDYRLTPSREGRYRLRDSLFSGAYFASNQTDVVVESPEAFEQWRQAARRSPLVPSPNAAAELWSQRQERGNRGWATVPPGPPPLVNVPLDLNAAHEG